MATTLTKKDAAVNAANALIGIMQQLKALRQQVNDFVTQYTQENYSAAWNAFATAAQNADGSLGGADGSPNTANPIDTRVTNQSGLSKAVTATQLVNAVATLQDLQTFLTGSGSLPAATRNANVDNLAS
jgi:hypothetical protein